MATYTEGLQKIWKQFEEEGNTVPVTALEVANWAIRRGLWKARPEDIAKRCAEDLARAAREEYRTDKYGRRYRVRHSAMVKEGGVQLHLWADIDKAPRKHMVSAFSQRRRQIVGDCHQLKVDVDHYNNINSNGLPIQMVFDFTEDLAEIEVLELPKKASGSN